MFWAGGRAYGRELDWVDDLVSPDPAARAGARARFRQTYDEFYRLQREINVVWATAGTLHPRDRALAARTDRLLAAQQEAAGYSLIHTLWRGWPALYRGPEWFRGDPAELVGYSLRYLEWEAWYPAEWHKHWITKAGQLEALAGRADLGADARGRLVELVIAAVRRDHRCEDRGYALVARSIDDATLRGRLAAETRAAEEVIRWRAGFLLHLLDHRAEPATAGSWKRWLALHV